MVFRTSFPSLSTKHWPVKTVMDSAGCKVGGEGEHGRGGRAALSCGPAACPSAGDSRPRLSLPSGDSSDAESRQDWSEGWGSPVEPQHPMPSTSFAPWSW